MVKSTESKPKSGVGKVEMAGAVCVSDLGTAVKPGGESRDCVRICLTRRVSIFEEPCAGKWHTGTCAGGRRATGVPTATDSVLSLPIKRSSARRYTV